LLGKFAKGKIFKAEYLTHYMGEEWVKVELYGANNDGSPRRYTIADNASVSKGALLELLDDRTVSCAIKARAPIAGVALEEHLPNKGVTDISCWTDGVFRVVASGTIVIGDPLTAAGIGVAAENNRVMASCATVEVVGTLKSHGNMRALDAVTEGTTLSVVLKC